MSHEEYSELDHALEGRIKGAYDMLDPSPAVKERIWSGVAAYRAEREHADADDAPTNLADSAGSLSAASVASNTAAAALADASSDEVAFGLMRSGQPLADTSEAAELTVLDDLVLEPVSSEQDGSAAQADAAAVSQEMKRNQTKPTFELLSFEDALQLESDPQDVSGADAEEAHEAEEGGSPAAESATGDAADSPTAESADGAASDQEAGASPSRRKIVPWKIIVPAAAVVGALGIGLFAFAGSSGAPLTGTIAPVGAAGEKAANGVSETGSGETGSSTTNLDLSNMSSTSSSSAQHGTGLTTYNANTNAQTETAAAVDSGSGSGRSGANGSRETATIIIDSGSGSGGSNPAPVAQDSTVEAPTETMTNVAPTNPGGETTEYVAAEQDGAPVETQAPAEAYVDNGGGGGGGNVTYEEVVVYDSREATWGTDYSYVTLPDGTRLTLTSTTGYYGEVELMPTGAISGTAYSSDGSRSAPVTVYQAFKDPSTYYVTFSSDSGFFSARS